MTGKNRHGAQAIGGFTLIEILVVLAIIGIMSAIAIPDVTKRLPHYRLVSAGTALQADIQYTIARAAKVNAIHCFTNISDTGYQIIWDCNQNRNCNDDTSSDCTTAPHVIIEASYEDGNSTHHYPGVRINTGDSTSFTLVFTPKGAVENEAGNPTEAVFFIGSIDPDNESTFTETMKLDVYALGVVEISWQ